MTIEIVLLALATTVRPTSLAAVYALLQSAAPRRLMLLYVVSGLAFTVAFGLLVIWAFNGVDIGSGTDLAKGVAELLGGAALILFGAAVLGGRISGPHADDAPRPPGRLSTVLQRRTNRKTAVIAGPATHVPGLFYLVALNIIVSHQPRWPIGMLEVLIYNVVWFVLPLVALALCIVRASAALDVVHAVEGWARRHTREILVVVSFAAGGALLVRGALAV